MDRPAIPESIKRQLRQESNFGCVLCGSPIIEYHHIEPYAKVQCHERSNLVILCPEHHHRANCGEIFEEKVIEAKNNPYNKNNEYIGKDFFLKKYELLKVKIGGITYLRTPIILEIDDKALVTMRPDESGYALFSAKFYNSRNILLAEIIDNEWKAYLDNEFWDIKYSPGHLKINNEKNKILLEFKLNSDQIELRAEMYYNGFKCSFVPNKSMFGSATFMNGIISDCRVGAHANSGK